ncbi:hypothetical protein LRP88_00674 [Fusarium phalaenopsidis]
MAFASPWAVAQPTFGFPQFHQFTPALPDVSQAAAMLAAAPGPYQELTRRLEIYKQKLAAQDGTLLLQLYKLAVFIRGDYDAREDDDVQKMAIFNQCSQAFGDCQAASQTGLEQLSSTHMQAGDIKKDEMQQLERDIQRALDQTKLEMDAIRQQAEQNQHDVEVWARQQQEAADALQQAQDEREHTALAPTGPDGYDDVYSSIMDKIASQAPHCAHLSERCLPWLTFAKRPLSVLELQEAMAISIDGNAGLSFEDSPAGVASVFSSCSGLAHLDCINGTSCIRLYDRTARDYLRRRLSRAEGDVGRGCIAYLLSRSDGGACKTDEDLVKRLRLSPLYDYAASYWGQHIQSISTPLLPHTVIRDFLSDRTRWEGALQAEHTAAQMRLRGLKQPCEDVSQYYPKRTEMIHLAARAGATNLITALLAQNYGSTIINARDHDGRTALSYAAQAGNDDTLEMLLANSLLDVDARDYQGGTPISHTADNGHASVVSRLLERSANPNWKDQDAVSPLWYAVQHGHVAVVRMLLECGQLSDLNPRHLWAPKSRLTPLSYALKNGFSEISELLARANGIDAHADLWEHGSTILGLAIRNRYEGIALRLLTKYGIGRSSRNTNLGGELLVVAASIGRTKLVESLLVMHGVDPNATYPYNRQEEFGGLTPLMAAAKKGHGVVVKLLLSTEAIRPDASALSLAAQNGFRDIVDMLVADGRVEADHQDAKGRTPLSLAAEGAHEDVVEALLMNETVDPDCRDDEGRTPLSRATGTACDCPNNLLRRYKGVVRRLLADARVDPNSRDKEGNTPLYYAAKNGDVSLVEAILEHPRTDLGFGNKREALAAAASKGRVEVVGAFLKMGRFDVNALMAYPDECLGRTLLSLGAEGGHMGVVDLLLSQPGIEAHKRDTEGRTPLAMAAWGGRTAIVERLLAVEGADPNSRDIRGWTPLRMAVTRAYRSIDTVEALLRLERIDPDPADVEGRTPLSVVCEHANLELFDLLLAFGSVDPDSRDTAGRNPLSWAVERSFTEIDRQVEVIRRLLQIRAVDPNAEDAEGLTPLIRAIQSIHGSEFVRILLEREDLDVHQRSRDGRRWIDTMFLGVVPYSMRDITKYDWKDDLASFVFKSGFIGRLGSNCEHRTRAITVTRIEDGVDFAVAKAWIACCREEHSRRCNPRTLARVPHFRLIDCTTRRVVRPGDQVPSYVALSYVWGLPPAASLGEESKLKPDVSDLPRDGFDIGESVEAVVEDAILVTLGLGYGFLWVDRYCILQKSDGKVKEEQLQNMDLVYANAEVTLVATAGQASSSGLPGVSSRCPRVPQPSVRIKGHVITLIPPDPALQIKSSTWMTRGWTCQEGLLTRRRLFFSESEMSFECRDLLTREAIRLPPDVQRQMGHLGRRLMEPSWIYGSLEMASSHKGGIDLFDLLAEYTRRKLAYQSDALNAMLGILQAYATRKRSPVYHVCGVPILRGSGNRFFERRHFGASNDGGSDNAEFALAGFIGALCWTLQSPGVRRPGFPSWSWTGWHNVVDFPPGEYRRITAFADGFDVEVSIVLADGVTPMPWSDYYGRLRNAAVKGIRFNPVFSQHHMLDITANIIIAQFYRRQVFCSNGMNWCGIACAGDDVCGGHLALTQSDSPPSSGDNEIGFVPSLRRRLLEESWLGIVLGHGGSMLYVLVLQEMPPSTIGATTHWERLGLLTIAQPTLKDEMLERRKLRLG